MSSDPIRAALERLVELNDGCTADHWHAAITAARAALAAAPEGDGLEPTHEQISQWINANPVLRPGSTGGPMVRVGTDWCAAFADAARWGAQFRPAAPPAPPEGKVGELVDELELMANQAVTACQFGDAMTLSVAATLLSRLSAAAPAVVPDGPAVPKSTEPASVASEATGQPRPLSPAAQAVLDAFTDAACGSTYELRLGIAAALRAVADQVVSEPPDCGSAWHDYNKGAEDRQKLVRFRLLAIAAELEGTNG